MIPRTWVYFSSSWLPYNVPNSPQYESDRTLKLALLCRAVPLDDRAFASDKCLPRVQRRVVCGWRRRDGIRTRHGGRADRFARRTSERARAVQNAMLYRTLVRSTHGSRRLSATASATAATTARLGAVALAHPLKAINGPREAATRRPRRPIMSDTRASFASSSPPPPPSPTPSSSEEVTIVSVSKKRDKEPSPEGERTSSNKHRKTRTPPTSLQDYLASKPYLYVTDLVGPVWCEYSHQYNILGMSHLPISQRPETITLPSGKQLRPRADLVQNRDKIVKAGTKIHAKLEREIHPEKITVQTATAEDQWALRLLKLVIGLRSLIDGGCVRELPVFGWADNYLVVGIIDEIERRPLSARRQRQVIAMYNDLNSPPDKDDQAKLPFADASAASTSNAASTPKTWSSQEEWKAHQRKVDSAKKAAAKSKAKGKSPQKGKAAQLDSSIDPKQKGLQSFFQTAKSENQDVNSAPNEIPASQPTPARPEAFDPVSTAAKLRGFYLTDTKTRTVDMIPQVGEQRAARLQTMMYKRMLDGLCQGAVARALRGRSPSDASSLEYKSIGIRGDPDALPLDFASVFTFLDLRPEKALSQAFRHDAQQLLDDIDVSKLPPEVGQTIAGHASEGDDPSVSPRKLSLSDMVHVVDEALIELLVLAERNCSVPASTATDDELRAHILRHRRQDASAVQADLSIIYRLQQRKKKSQQRTEAAVPAVAEMIKRSLEGQAELSVSNDMEHGHGFEAISAPPSSSSQGKATRRSRRLAGASAASHNEKAPRSATPPPTIDARTTSLLSSPESASPPQKHSVKIIGQIDFPALPFHLSTHIKSVMQFWHGRRDPIGVGEDETWKCRGCEWLEGCEWRHGKGEEKRMWAAQRRKARLTASALGRRGQSASGDDVYRWATREDLPPTDNHSKSACSHNEEAVPRHHASADDDEELLWAQLEDVEADMDIENKSSNGISDPGLTLSAPEQDWVETQADVAG